MKTSVTIQSVRFGEDQIQVTFVDDDARKGTPAHALNVQRDAVTRKAEHLERVAASLLGDVMGVPPPELAGLGPRGVEVLQHIAAGEENSEIAERLFMSPNTVKTHLAQIFDVLGVHNRTSAAMAAMNLGLIPREDS